MGVRGRVMGHIAIIMYRSRWVTRVMGYMGDGAHGQWGTQWMYSVKLVNIFTEYGNFYLWDASGEFIVHILA